ncbi:MAG: hydrogenase expression/formation protein HypE [Eubacteriales bacterium]|nr:hydrogenase expression/formation protein HypE [Eubacteriales bacterium]
MEQQEENGTENRENNKGETREEIRKETSVTLAHGAGGRQTAQLIGQVFRTHFENPEFTADDAALLQIGGERLAFTTDGFIVSPWKFAGGDIGKLSVCGTVNDLACMGAKPRALSCAFVIEEGFLTEDLERIAASMAEAAAEAGVRIVAGDTKVAGRGQVDHIFITTTGIGEVLPEAHTSGALAESGDAVIVTGDVGRHGCAILLEREEFGIEAQIESDCAPLWETVRQMFAVTPQLHVLRDATRGGVGTVLHEIAAESGVGIAIRAQDVPVDPAVRGVCGMLGLEPLYLACEGRLVVIAPQEYAGALVKTLRALPYSGQAAVIGEVTREHPGRVVMETAIGAKTLLPPPGGELLPRIC